MVALASSCRRRTWIVFSSTTIQHFDLTLGVGDEQRGEHRVATSSSIVKALGHDVLSLIQVAVKRRAVSETNDGESEAWPSDNVRVCVEWTEHLNKGGGCIASFCQPCGPTPSTWIQAKRTTSVSSWSLLTWCMTGASNS